MDGPEKGTVIGLCGSLRPEGYTRQALAVALAGAAELGAKTRLVDLNDYALPLCDGNEHEEKYPAGVAQLRDDVRRAEGIILATPEYHGGYSGVLKNALDLMGFDEFEGKMIGLVGVAGGRGGAFTALHSLRDVCRALHAWVIPEQVSLSEVWSLFDAQGNLKDKELETRVKEIGRQVARFARLHNSDQTREFLRQWEEAPENPGAD